MSPGESDVPQSPDNQSSVTPLVVEREGRHLVVAGWYDVDGTANNESLPEAERLNSLQPAFEATSQLERLGIATAPITSRSFGESLPYYRRLGGSGPPIIEDGSVIIAPRAFDPKHIRNVHGVLVIQHEGQTAIVLSRLDRATIKQFICEVEQVIDSKLITSLTSPPELLQQVANHHSLEMAKASADRIASAYIEGVTPRQREVIFELAEKRGIRAFGDVINLNDARVDKGHALKYVAQNSQLFFNDRTVEGIIPIVFGNHQNDVPLFDIAHTLEGIAVLVGHPDGGFYLKEEEAPDYVVKADAPYGYGMQKAIPLIVDRLNSQYGLSLS